MADPDAELTVDARGRTYTLFFGNKAFRMIERELHKPLVRLNEESLDELTTVIWAGFLSRHPDITFDEVDEIVDEIGYEKLGDFVRVALEKALPEASREPQGNRNRATRRAAAANGTGKAS